MVFYTKEYVTKKIKLNKHADRIHLLGINNHLERKNYTRQCVHLGRRGRIYVARRIVNFINNNMSTIRGSHDTIEYWVGTSTRHAPPVGPARSPSIWSLHSCSPAPCRSPPLGRHSAHWRFHRVPDWLISPLDFPPPPSSAVSPKVNVSDSYPCFLGLVTNTGGWCERMHPCGWGSR